MTTKSHLSANINAIHETNICGFFLDTNGRVYFDIHKGEFSTKFLRTRSASYYEEGHTKRDFKNMKSLRYLLSWKPSLLVYKTLTDHIDQNEMKILSRRLLGQANCPEMKEAIRKKKEELKMVFVMDEFEKFIHVIRSRFSIKEDTAFVDKISKEYLIKKVMDM